jgi:antitoxin component YwqK of YwqJK toxin-antitoxin module
MAQYIRKYSPDAKSQLKEEYYEVNGKKEGVYKSYHDNGQLSEICNYVNGKKNGEYISL